MSQTHNIESTDNIHAEEMNKAARLFKDFFGYLPDKISLLAESGSNRRYYRLDCDECTTVATFGDDIAENKAFIGISNHICVDCQLSLPLVLKVSEDYKSYLQTWVGKQSLFEWLSPARESGVYTEKDVALLENTMRLLAYVQYEGGKELDYSICYPCSEMNSRLVHWDLNYFKYCFLKPAGIEFNENRLQDEFDRLEIFLMCNESKWKTFMLRDFQSRNVMIDDDCQCPNIIDFQGGRRGPAAYDVASFLWQAKARYPENLRHHLIDVYIDKVKEISPDFSAEQFREELPFFVLFRNLQTLGAYGFRGWMERKPHFLQSISLGVDNLAELLNNNPQLTSLFPLLKVLSIELRDKFGCEAAKQKADKYSHTILAHDNPLTVCVTSFSYKKGLPVDETGNGGGFVFDCRAPHNPGRYEPYKHLTGLDAPVREFLEADGEIKPFIEECLRLIDSSVERYLQRGFTNLAVNFGCTGGQHRSVYSADAVAKHLNDKYGVKVVVLHREQNISSVLPAKDVKVVFDSFLKNPQKQYNSQA